MMNVKSRNGAANAREGAGPKPFAGRSVLADALRQRDISAEVAEEFRSVGAAEVPVAFPKDSIQVERELADAFGMRLRVFEPPKESLSQSQIDRMSADVKKAVQAAKKAPALKETPVGAEAPPPLGVQILEEFASQYLKVGSPQVDSPSARAVISNISGTCMSVRKYSRSKKKDLRSLDSE